MEIVPNVHVLPGGFVNFYLIDEPAGLTLIDTGLSRHFKTTLHAIKQLGRSPADLKTIVLTHSDGDHVGALADLKAICGARAYTSPIEARAIEHARPSRELKMKGWQKQLFKLATPLFKIKPTQIDGLLEDGQTLPILGGLRVLYTPGHTPGHISLYAPEARLLFCGDSMVAGKDGTLRCSRGMNTWDEAQAKESVRMQQSLGAQIVCSGHGPSVRDAAGKFPTE
jgi:glyoxylase-like metal-dependent hydrolase (beta-lactamase superfamily II)